MEHRLHVVRENGFETITGKEHRLQVVRDPPHPPTLLERFGGRVGAWARGRDLFNIVITTCKSVAPMLHK